MAKRKRNKKNEVKGLNQENATALFNKIIDLLPNHALENLTITGLQFSQHFNEVQNIRPCNPGEEPKLICDEFGHCVPSCIKPRK